MPAPSSTQRFLACAGLVAATYAYFLLFAQFAFLDLAAVRIGPGRDLQTVIHLQGLGGIGGSLLAALIFRPGRAGALVAVGLILAGTAAAAAPSAKTFSLLAAVAGVTGLAVGVTTVALAAQLRAWVGLSRLGLCVGLGTGLAYALCSVPAFFEAPPEHQALAAAAMALLGAALVTLVQAGTDALPPRTSLKSPALPWFLVFGGLVALDSAAFYIIQNTAELKEAAWSGVVRQWGVAAVHLVAGLVAGRLLDAGRSRLLPALALAGIVGACLLLDRPAGWLSLVYASGVSLYSAALVHHPARIGRARYAAAFYVACGWVASGVGLGLAQGLQEVSIGLWLPLALLAGAGIALARREET